MNRQEHLDSDIEELMSTSETGANSQKGDSDEESSATLETVEYNDVGFSSERNWQEETSEQFHKKKREEEKGMSSEIELMVSQLTTIVRELEKHEFWNVVDVLRENWNDEIDGVIANMICLAETAWDSRVPEEHKPFYEKLIKKWEKKIRNKACLIASSIRGSTKSIWLGCKDCETNAPYNLLRKQLL